MNDIKICTIYIWSMVNETKFWILLKLVSTYVQMVYIVFIFINIQLLGLNILWIVKHWFHTSSWHNVRGLASAPKDKEGRNQQHAGLEDSIMKSIVPKERRKNANDVQGVWGKYLPTVVLVIQEMYQPATPISLQLK